VVAVADDGLADAGGDSWRGPWDFGTLALAHGSASLVLGHGDRALLASIAADVDAAIPAVSAVWGTGWPRHVAVIVPSSAAELAAEVSEGSPVTTDLAAAAVADSQDPVTGAVLGQRLIVNPAALARLSPLGRRIVIRHEVTHIATARATSDATPRWLVEGFAEYVGNLGSGQPVGVAAAELGADVRAGTLPAALPAAAGFDTAATSARAYEQAWLACRLIAVRTGPAGLVRFYRAVDADAGDGPAAVGAALRTVLHESLARFTADWRAYLRAELGTGR
jgi:hypothetical protein